ncbi:MAG: hypothetical protein NZL85_03700 [Fimbriimonadales bacterium]|nr:hypothetical protein [Fimbriimonadales bacterium]
MPITVDDLNDLVRLLDEHPDWQEALARRLLSERTLQQLLRTEPELRAALRRMILDEEFMQLPAIVRELVEVSRESVQRLDRLEQTVAELAEISRQSVERLGRVEARTEHLEQRMEERFEQVDRRFEQVDRRFEQVEERLIRVEDGVNDWKEWRRGEDGRREGERYERKILRQASRLLKGGSGGSPDHDEVRHRLATWLAQAKDDAIEDENDPSLADILWWKGDRVAVIEVSQKVDGRDVLRAKLRAETLRRAGVEAMPLVIGEEWAHPESKQLAQQEGVEWLVEKEASPGFVAFRQVVR